MEAKNSKVSQQCSLCRQSAAFWLVQPFHLCKFLIFCSRKTFPIHIISKVLHSRVPRKSITSECLSLRWDLYQVARNIHSSDKWFRWLSREQQRYLKMTSQSRWICSKSTTRSQKVALSIRLDPRGETTLGSCHDQLDLEFILLSNLSGEAIWMFY